MPPEDQLVRYARFREYDLAWSSVGSGPMVVLGGWWSSHLVYDWNLPEFRDFVGRFTAHRTVIRFDPPGVGLSRHPAGVPLQTDVHAGALAAVIEAAGGGGESPVPVVAGSSGVPVAIALAAKRPELVDRLVLYGGYRRGADIASPRDRAALVEMVRRNWGLSSRVLADAFLPESTGRERREFALQQRLSASAEDAAAALAMTYELDASPFIAHVKTPTLVLHRRGDRAIRFALGRDLADSISEAHLHALEGVDHFPWRGDAAGLAHEILAFLGVRDDSPDSARADRAPAAPLVDPASSGLTPRETQVLTLVAGGLTDAEIGTQLYLSPHTVHRHVANARAKLGVSTRGAAAAIVAAAQAREDAEQALRPPDPGA